MRLEEWLDSDNFGDQDGGLGGINTALTALRFSPRVVVHPTIHPTGTENFTMATPRSARSLIEAGGQVLSVSREAFDALIEQGLTPRRARAVLHGKSRGREIPKVVAKAAGGKPFKYVLPLSQADTRRFMFRLGLRERGKCWVWPNARSRFGHGRFKVAGRLESTHRVAFAIWKGDELVSGNRRLVLHSCDNPACCNPAHLRLGTHRDNVMDMIERDRQPQQLRNPPPPPRKRVCEEARP